MVKARRLVPLLAPLVLLAGPAALAVVQQPPLRPKGVFGPLGDERLSNETTLTRWAHTGTRRTAARGQGARGAWPGPVVTEP